MKATEQQKLAMRQYWAATRDVRRAKKLAHYDANKERIKVSDRLRYHRHKHKHKASRSIARRKRYLKNRDAELAYTKAHRSCERDKFLEQQRIYRENNREKLNADARRSYNSDLERNRAVKRERYHLNRDSARTYQRQYIATNYEKLRPKMAARYRRYRSRHPQQASISRAARKARKLSVKTDSTATRFFNFVRSKHRIPCYYCGKVISGKAAHIDHVVAISKFGNHTSDNLCASCPSCNLSKCAKSLAVWIPPTKQPMLNL